MTKPLHFTATEQTALRTAFNSARRNGHDFGFVEDLVRDLRPLGPQAVGALVTSLQQKGILEVHKPVTTDSGTFTQFTWNLEVAEVEALLFQAKSKTTDRAASRKTTDRSKTMTTKTKTRKTSTKDLQANDGRVVPDAKIVVTKAARTSDVLRRGLMGKMVALVAKSRSGLTREQLRKACKGQPRARVVKNVAWGIRHGVFGVSL